MCTKVGRIISILMLEVSKITRGHTCVGSSVFYEFGSIKFVYSLAGWTTRIRIGLHVREGYDYRFT